MTRMGVVRTLARDRLGDARRAAKNSLPAPYDHFDLKVGAPESVMLWRTLSCGCEQRDSGPDAERGFSGLGTIHLQEISG